MKPRQTGWLWLGITIAILGASAGIFFGPFTYNILFICDGCAMTHVRSDRQLPYVGPTYWSTEGPARHTPLSSFLTESRIVDVHEHHWISVRSAGNGVQCGIGRAGEVYRLAQREDIIPFFRFLQEKEQPEVVSRWLEFALDYRTVDDFTTAWIVLKNSPALEQAWWTNREELEQARVAALARVR